MGDVAAVLRVVFERLNERDLAGFRALCSPRIEFHEIPEIPGARTYRGPDEVSEWAEDLLGVSERIRFVNWEMQERGDAALIDMSVEMEGSGGTNMGWRAWTVWRVREQLLAYYAGYSEQRSAVADFEGGPDS